MKISVAQIKAVKGDIIANVARHKKCIDLAVSQHAAAIFFPELSLTGYEPELAAELATDQDDKRLDEFQEISNHQNITIGLGMPTQTNVGIQISMVIFQPNAHRQTYSKQQLHPDEFPYFVNGEAQVILTADVKKIAPAICYESLQEEHAGHAHQLGADIYLTSVAKSQNGLDKAWLHYPTIARKYAMPVLMANCTGPCDNYQSAGQSAVWSKEGHLVGQLDDKQEGILIFDTETEELIKLNF
ncbi:carbon-nitrogen hydrolase family protein [Pedobacter gandavensis]|uniref:Carbon-nitrogen hydrolase family protein n=1 Tax=Pedobacter gandavensis TaxID=2679963 RepID=A0ABR6ERV4_9SPHI|nr:carbon-nitrogen hydrolase family protein [Pedobacter gandavensis]MBB2147971.1 carbon-nitrogen hydrolase family protein [Pedobacter gandavensis]